MLTLNSDASVHFRHTLPDWLHPLGLRPRWTKRIYAIDETGRQGRKNLDKTDFAFSDADLTAQFHLLSTLSGLHELHASETQLTDTSLEHLDRLPELRLLDDYNAPMTHEAVHDFQQTHPNVEGKFFD